MTELSNLCGLAQVRAVKKSCHAALVFSQGDVFAKSEKWLGTPPTPDCAKWTSREAEILGWQAYIYDLTAWAMQASLEFGSEIEHACRWPDPLHWNQLAVPQRACENLTSVVR